MTFNLDVQWYRLLVLGVIPWPVMSAEGTDDGCYCLQIITLPGKVTIKDNQI